MKQKFNFLYISHELSATGAPIVFLNTIREIQKEFDTNVYIYAVKSGELQYAFREIADNLVLEGDIESLLGWPSFDLAYFNSIESSHVYDLLMSKGLISDGTRIVLHAHEMFGTVHKYGIEKSKILIDKVNIVFCASTAVRENLEQLGFCKEKLFTVRPLVAINQSNEVANSFIDVIACGEISFNKGIDYFIQVAKQYKEKHPEKLVNFSWIGPDSRKLKALVEWDIRKLNLVGNVKFVGYRKDVLPYFKQAKVFFLPSRQDSFPLVCLEALSAGLPILFFKESGGMGSFLDSTCSVTVEYLNIEDGVNKLNNLLNLKEDLSRLSLGAYAKYHEYVKNMNNDMNSIIKKLKNILI